MLYYWTVSVKHLPGVSERLLFLFDCLAGFVHFRNVVFHSFRRRCKDLMDSIHCHYYKILRCPMIRYEHFFSWRYV